VFGSELRDYFERRRAHDGRELLNLGSGQVDDGRRRYERIIAGVQSNDRLLPNTFFREMADVRDRKRINDEPVVGRPCVVEDDEELCLSSASRKVMEYRAASASLRIGEIVVKRHALILRPVWRLG
jgi:hypothetical protein